MYFANRFRLLAYMFYCPISQTGAKPLAGTVYSLFLVYEALDGMYLAFVINGGRIQNSFQDGAADRTGAVSAARRRPHSGAFRNVVPRSQDAS
jgi:hypothetical protein